VASSPETAHRGEQYRRLAEPALNGFEHPILPRPDVDAGRFLQLRTDRLAALCLDVIPNALVLRVVQRLTLVPHAPATADTDHHAGVSRAGHRDPTMAA